MGGFRILAVALVALLIFVGLAQAAAPTNWIPDANVSVNPSQTKGLRTVTFQVTVQNSGVLTLTVCQVDIKFEWNPALRNVFTGTEAIAAGASKTWMIDETIPDLEPKSYMYVVTVNAMSLPDLFCSSNDWKGTIEIVANQAPNAAFSFAPPTPAPDAVVYFTDASADPDGTIVEWFWDFGDAVNSTDRNPTHQFSSAGPHPVVLTVTDSDGSKDSASHNVEVLANVSPVAAFSFSPANVKTTTTVLFSDGSSDSDGTIATWRWDFGDGTNSNERNPSHRFTSARVHPVSLIVTDNDGSTDSVTQNVEVLANVAPISAFSFNPANANTSTSIRFTDESTDSDGSVVLWRWEFGDGTTSNEQNPTHQFVAQGTYQVTLTVTDETGATNAITQNIQIAPVPSTNQPRPAGFGVLEWGLVAAAVGAIGIAVAFVAKRKLRPARRWGQANSQPQSSSTKSRWRPP